jgi:hypothetical protein
MPVSAYLANALLNHVFHGSSSTYTYTPPTTVYLSLHTGDPDDGNEISSYTRIALTCTIATDGSLANSGTVTFTGLPSVPAGVSWIGIYDALEGGNLLFKEEIATQAVGNGDSWQWIAGELTISTGLT